MQKRVLSFLVTGMFIVSGFQAPLVWAGGGEGIGELESLKSEFKSMQEKMGTMQRRIEELETAQTQVKQEVKQVSQKQEEVGVGVAPALKWKGYFTWNYEDETKGSANPSFDAFALALIPTVTLNEKVDIYSQIIYEHAPFYDISVASTGTASRTLDGRSSGETTINDMYLTYKAQDWLKLRAGKFAAPFGIWNTLQYAGPTYPTIKQPGRDTFYSRGSSTDTDANFFARYAMGAWLLGSYESLSYDLYVTNGRTKLAQHKDDNRDKGLGLRLANEFSLGSAKLKALYSYYQDKLRSDVTQAFFNQQTNAFGLEFSAGDLKLTGEYALSKRQGLFKDAAYLLAQYSIGEKFIPYAQYQWDEPNRKNGEDGTHYFSLGLAYQLIPWRTVLKFQIDNVQPEKDSDEENSRYLIGLAAAF